MANSHPIHAAVPNLHLWYRSAAAECVDGLAHEHTSTRRHRRRTGALILTPIGLAAINVILASLLTNNDDAWYYRNILSREVKKAGGIQTEKAGTIFLEIDGLAESVLRKAISKGCLPTLASWLERGSHKITSWETDLSSQTGASQAGILHGNNQDLPAFRWVEKEHDNKIMVSTGFSDAPQNEARISDGQGL